MVKTVKKQETKTNKKSSPKSKSGSTKVKKDLLKSKITKPKPTEVVVRKTHRFRPGTVALREIKHYQKTQDTLIPRLPFVRLLKQIAYKLNNDLNLYKPGEKIQIQKSAVNGLQETLEGYLVRLFEDSNLMAIHANRVTLHSKDILLTKKVRCESM